MACKGHLLIVLTLDAMCVGGNNGLFCFLTAIYRSNRHSPAYLVIISAGLITQTFLPLPQSFDDEDVIDVFVDAVK